MHENMSSPKFSQSQGREVEGRCDIRWKKTLTQILKETKPKARTFKLLHGQWETQASTGGYIRPLKRRIRTQRE